MQPSVFWLGALILFAVGEGITVGLTSIWFAIGSLGALIVSGLGGAIWLQAAVFLALSGLSLLLVRPLAQKYLKPGYSATNADRVIGRTAMVTEEIDNLKGTGLVSVSGQVWTARSEYDVVIPAGTEVTILRIEGVKVFVERIVP
jgi:membrane protein implicated in regulation of membrane protease activity